ncbi:tape measure protein [Paremcibacter congregatus]|uniref:tape measure protein n=1 Tax=Paremcibacter congregatus TaxID=2043170 RepID=UPI0030EBA574|tara:strand:- start:1332 stop:3332 length:2001 start_codon:yes stop_codon:yes gene_type:complete
MNEELAAMIVRLEADATRLNANLVKAGRMVDGKLDGMDRRLKKSDARFAKWGKNIALNVRLGLAAAVIYAGKQALVTADQVDVLQDRIKDATKATGGFETVWDGIASTAIKTGSAISGNVELVQRLAIAAEDLGGTNSEILRLNETVQKLGVISGASMSSLNAGTTQLAQGLGAGTFRAEEFNSLLENIPAVANLIAKNLGKSTAELRAMVLAGDLTSKAVFAALLEGSEDVDKRFSEIPPRLERAWSSMLTAISLGVDDINTKLGITEGLAGRFQVIAKTITSLRESDGNILGFNELDKINNALEQNEAQLERIADKESEEAKRIKQRIGLLQDEWSAIIKRNSVLLSPESYSLPGSIFPSNQLQLGMSITPRDKPTEIPVSDETMVPKPRPGNEANKTAYLDAEDAINKLIAASRMEEQQVGKSAATIARMNAELEIYTALMEKGGDVTDEQRQAIDKMLDAYEAQATATEKSIKQFEELDAMADQFAEDFGDIFIDSIGRGEDALSSLVSTFKNALLKMAVDAAIINPLKKLFSPKGGNLFGGILKAVGSYYSGGTSSLASSAISYSDVGGAYADGGNPPVGKISMVGERGPELFIPKQSGTIIPNHKLGGSGGGVVINVDARGATNPAEVEAAANRAVAKAVPQIMKAQDARMISRQRPGFA